MSSSDETTARPPALRILIVDDNEAAAQTTGWMVEMMGYDYHLAHTPDDAIAGADGYAPHVVLLDIGLPGMNGFDLCRLLRALPALTGTVFIAQTGWARDDYKQRAFAAGFQQYLVKPLDFDDLAETLKVIEETVVHH